MRWRDDPARKTLLSLYEQADALVSSATCACSVAAPVGEGEETAPCCRFAVTGREPYPTAVELAEVEHAMRARGGAGRRGRRLPLASELRTCPLLSEDARCTIYASRPLGCRTFFCERGDGPPKAARQGLLELARKISDLSACVCPEDPRPRPFLAALKRMT